MFFKTVPTLPQLIPPLEVATLPLEPETLLPVLETPLLVLVTQPLLQEILPLEAIALRELETVHQEVIALLVVSSLLTKSTAAITTKEVLVMNSQFVMVALVPSSDNP